MDYDYRKRVGGYDVQGQGEGAAGMYGRPAQQSSFYPRISHPMPMSSPPPPSLHSNPNFTSSSYSSPPSGLTIRVAIKPEYRITPPPSVAPLAADIPRSTFQFDFEFERKVLAEAEKESQNWNRLAGESPSSRIAESPSSQGSVDPLVNKYVASGLGREAVTLAVANYGDNPTKVREFVNAYNLLREMGFSSKNVAEVLAMYDNDTDKALAHFLNNSS